MAGWALVSVVYFASGFAICWKHPNHVWFTGLLLNATLLVQSVTALGLREVWENTPFFALTIASAYAGAIAGAYPEVLRRRTHG